MSWVLVGLAAVPLLGLVVLRSVLVVPIGHVAVVERLGRYSRTLEPGLHRRIPLVDRVRTLVSLGERVVPVPSAPVPTADHQQVDLGADVRLVVTDPCAATYEIADVDQAVAALTRATLEHWADRHTRAELLEGRGALERALRDGLAEVGARWGVQATRTSVLVAPESSSGQRPLSR